MNKMARIIINLSVVVFVLLAGAQYYTNQQIDKALQAFPYHFKDKFTIHIQQQEKTFFTRKLVLSVESRNSNDVETSSPIDLVYSKLTALPFVIISTSELQKNIIRLLNNQFGITIDANNISTKYSVVSNSLQTDANLMFRDLTNQPQTMNAELKFVAKSQAMTLNASLSGFNFDNINKINAVDANFDLQSLSSHQFDITKANVLIKDIDYIDNQNQYIKAKDLNYQLNKKINSQDYDLSINVAAKNLNLAIDTYKIDIQAINLVSAQLGINNNNVPFYDQFMQINAPSAMLQASMSFLLNYLFDNNHYKLSAVAEQVDIINNAQQATNQQSAEQQKIDQQNTSQAKINAKNIIFDVSLNNQDKKDASFAYHINFQRAAMQNIFVGEVKAGNVTFDNINIRSDANNLNVQDHLSLFKKFIATRIDNNTNVTDAEDRDEKFLSTLKAMAKNYHASSNFNAKIEKMSANALNYNVDNDSTFNDITLNNGAFNLNNLELNYQEVPYLPGEQAVDNQYHGKFLLTLKQLILKQPILQQQTSSPQERLALTNLKLDIPYFIGKYDDFYLGLLCNHAPLYFWLCTSHLAEHEYSDLTKVADASQVSIENAELTAFVQAMSSSNKIGGNIEASFSFHPLPENYLVEESIQQESQIEKTQITEVQTMENKVVESNVIGNETKEGSPAHLFSAWVPGKASFKIIIPAEMVINNEASSDFWHLLPDAIMPSGSAFKLIDDNYEVKFNIISEKFKREDNQNLENNTQ